MDDLILVLGSAEPDQVAALADRFAQDVIAPYQEQVADYGRAAGR